MLRAKLLLILFRPWFSVDDLLHDEATGQAHDGFVSAWAAYETALTDRAARFARDPDGHGLFSSEWFAWHALAVIRNLDYSTSGHEVAEALEAEEPAATIVNPTAAHPADSADAAPKVDGDPDAGEPPEGVGDGDDAATSLLYPLAESIGKTPCKNRGFGKMGFSEN